MFAMFVDSFKCDPQLATRCAQNATCSVSQREYQCEYKTGSDNWRPECLYKWVMY